MERDLVKIDTELINCSATKIAVCLCIDISGSMDEVVTNDFVFTGETVFEDGQEWNLVKGGKTRMQLLYQGIDTFISTIKKDPIARRSVELTIVAFNDDVQILNSFSSVENIQVPHVDAKGETDMGRAVMLATDLLEERKQQYKENGVEYYRPILVVMSDGANNGDEELFDEACERIHEFEGKGKISTFLVGMGEGSDLEGMSRISCKNPAKQLSESKFKEFFKWLSKSVSVVSQSTPGDRVQIPSTKEWEL